MIFNVSIQFRPDNDHTGQNLMTIPVEAKNKIQAVDIAAKHAKLNLPDYSELRHDLFYVAIPQ